MEDLIFLDNYVLQQDMRIRLPKSVLSNLNAEKGITRFNIYLNLSNKSLVLKPEENDKDEE